MAERPRTISDKPRPNRTPGSAAAHGTGTLAAISRHILRSAADSRRALCSEHGRVCRVPCPSRYLAPAAAQRSATKAGRLSDRGWLGSSWLLHRQSKRTAVCTDLCRRPVSTRQGTAAEYR